MFRRSNIIIAAVLHVNILLFEFSSYFLNSTVSPHPGGLEVLLNVFPHDTEMERALFGCHGFGVMTISGVLSLAVT